MFNLYINNIMYIIYKCNYMIYVNKLYYQIYYICELEYTILYTSKIYKLLFCVDDTHTKWGGCVCGCGCGEGGGEGRRGRGA